LVDESPHCIPRISNLYDRKYDLVGHRITLEHVIIADPVTDQTKMLQVRSVLRRVVEKCIEVMSPTESPAPAEEERFEKRLDGLL